MNRIGEVSSTMCTKSQKNVARSIHAAAAAAIVAIYLLGAALCGPRAALLAAALVAVDAETSRWHLFVLNDSLYLSLLAASAWAVFRFVEDATPHWRPAVTAIVSLTL